MCKPSKPKKKLFRVFGHTTVNVMTVVYGKDEDDALAKASNKLDMLTAYCGNGGLDKLVGVDLRLLHRASLPAAFAAACV